MSVEASEITIDDPFEALGVSSAASDDEIKAAYRKLVLQCHPDKNPGNEEAAAKFQKVSTAYSILSNPELRAKFEAGGMEAIDEQTLQSVEVDVTELGFVNSSLAAMYSKLGVPIKTRVTPAVLEQVQNRQFESTELTWGKPATGKVGNGQAVYYTLDINADQIKTGFMISASANHAKVKLLLWDMNDEGEWSLAAQEDPTKLGDHNAAVLFRVDGDMLEGVPRTATVPVTANADPFAAVFRTLDGAKPKDNLSLRPGTHLIGVYGDNFFKKSMYTLTATLLEDQSHQDAAREVEQQILEKRAEMNAFEREFKRVQQEYKRVVQEVTDHVKVLDGMLKKREDDTDKKQSATGVLKTAGSAINSSLKGWFGKKDKNVPK